MEINPYITVTGTIAEFDTEDRSFTMTPNQYTVLTHSYSVLPIHGHFGDWHSNKRWGTDGPKVTVGTTITFSGFFERVVRERTLDRTLQFVQVEVTSIAYLGTCSNLANSPTGISFFLQANEDSYKFNFFSQYQLQDLENDGIGMISVNHPNLLIQRLLPPTHKEKGNGTKMKQIMRANKRESPARKKKEMTNKFGVLQKLYYIFLQLHSCQQKLTLEI